MPVDMFPKILTQIRRIPISFIFVHIYYKNIGEALQICHLVNTEQTSPTSSSSKFLAKCWNWTTNYVFLCRSKLQTRNLKQQIRSLSAAPFLCIFTKYSWNKPECSLTFLLTAWFANDLVSKLMAHFLSNILKCSIGKNHPLWKEALSNWLFVHSSTSKWPL